MTLLSEIESRGSSELQSLQGTEYPLERLAMMDIQHQHLDSTGIRPVVRAIEAGMLTSGSVTCAEINPTLRCSEDCPGCPDALSELRVQIANGDAPIIEPRASSELLIERIRWLYELGVRHFMFIGGTIDNVPGLENLISTTLDLGDDSRVSWFTDGILLTDEASGKPNNLFKKHKDNGWLKRVSTHLSLDYPFGFPADTSSVDAHIQLPSKANRQGVFTEHPEYSRIFKSQYGIAAAKNLIDQKVRRIILNTTISPANIKYIEQMYMQVAQLQEYALNHGSPTEVLWTFSTWIWRPHQARGDNIRQHSRNQGLSFRHMDMLNKQIQNILFDTYARIGDGRARILANSSGFSMLHAISRSDYRQIVVDQDFAYYNGKPVMLNVTPIGDVWCDPMFPESEALQHKKDIWGYADRPYSMQENPFVIFHDQSVAWFPNIISQ